MRPSLARWLPFVSLLALGAAACGGAAATPEDGGADALAPQDDASPQDDAGVAGCPAPRKFWTWNLAVMPPADVQIPATCRAATANAYVYVADSVWGQPMTQAMVDTVVHAFEDATPADPSHGIYAIDTTTFGDPPDVDGDPHIYLVYFDMPGYGGYTFDGFFRDSDETTSSVSNHLEMLHLNATGQNAPDSDYMLGVVIHEFVHLIAYRYDDAEEGWLSEALAESAMTLGGYMTDLLAANQYVRATATTPLVVRTYPDYGAVMAFGSYLLERFGASMVRALVQDPAHGVASVDAQLQAVGASFREVFGDFMVANLIDQPALEDGRYGYEAFDVSALGHETTGALDGTSHSTDAKAWGARFLRYTPSGAGTVSVTLATPDYAKLVVRSVVLDPTQPANATVTAHAVTGTPTTIDLPVSAGEVVDLVVAVYWGSSLASADTASEKVTFDYTATYTP